MSCTSVAGVPLYILYGSATGNAEHIAKSLAESAKSRIPMSPWNEVVCVEANQYAKKCLPTWEKPPRPDQEISCALLVITSTTGNGDAPENASRFARYLKRCKNQLFEHVVFAVLALGDTNYDQFCACGKFMDKKIRELGGKSCQSIACADEGTGLETVVDPWMENIFNNLTSHLVKKNHETLPDNGNSTQPLGNTTTEILLEKTSEEKKIDTIVVESLEMNVTQEKNKLEPMEDQSASLPTPPINADAPKRNQMSGVELLRALLQLQSHEPLPPVNALPTLCSSACLSSCQLLAECSGSGSSSHLENGIEDTIDPLWETKSVSTASSGFHYTAKRPFRSTILQARYLTLQTLCDAAQQVTNLLLTNDNDNNHDDPIWLKQADSIYDSFFPLGSDKNSLEATKYNEKRVIEMTLSLPLDETLEYAPGDSMGLLVNNTLHDVDFVLAMLLQNGHISSEQQRVVVVSSCGEFRGTIREALSEHYIDLSSTNPLSTNTRTQLIRNLAKFATNDQERLALEFLAAATTSTHCNSKVYRTMIQDQKWSFVDLLRAFPSIQPHLTCEILFALLPPIPPRYYSISSCPPNGDQPPQLTICFSVVDYLTAPSLGQPQPRRIHGLATRYLENLCSPFLLPNQPNEAITKQIPTLRIFPKPTADFRLSSLVHVDKNKKEPPLILIGPGTGIAPFVGFLRHLAQKQEEQRHDDSDYYDSQENMLEGTWRGDFTFSPKLNHNSSSSSNGIGQTHSTPAVYLFFGCRYENHDYLYKDELAEMVNKGLITQLFVAFSRSTPSSSSKYVQDLMRLNAPLVRDLILTGNARVYLCGDGNQMAKDVQTTLVQVLFDQDDSEGRAYLEQLKSSKRFLLDIWS